VTAGFQLLIGHLSMRLDPGSGLTIVRVKCLQGAPAGIDLANSGDIGIGRSGQVISVQRRAKSWAASGHSSSKAIPSTAMTVLFGINSRLTIITPATSRAAAV
jgi:hypothetical protein